MGSDLGKLRNGQILENTRDLTREPPWLYFIKLSNIAETFLMLSVYHAKNFITTIDK